MIVITCLLFCLLIALLAVTAKTPCSCPIENSKWTILDDNTLVELIPEFFFRGDAVKVKTLMVCDHGVFFYFTDRNKEWCFAIPTPTYKRYKGYEENFIVDSLLAEKSLVDPIMGYALKDLEHFEKFLAKVKETLGNRFYQDKPINLEKNQATLEFTKPFVFTINGQQHEIYGLTDIYYLMPNKDGSS